MPSGCDVRVTRQRRAIAGRAAIAMLIVAACSSSDSGPPTLADYASGHWSCQFTATQPDYGARIDAIVSSQSATRGRVRLAFPITGGSPSAVRKQTGQWSLRGGHLVVKWDGTSMGPVNAQPVSLDTKQFRIRGDTSDPVRRGRWVTVNVDRQTRSATFAFTMPDTGGPGTLTCRKD